MAHLVASLKARSIQGVRFKDLNLLSGLTGLLAVSFLFEFIILALLRAGYPYELEWIEGASVDEIRYILQAGLPYVEPNIHFLPLLYNPVYFLLSAGLAKVIGTGFLAPRLISITASLGCFFFLYFIVARETGRFLPGLLAAGIYAASYRFSGAWMDLAKTDSLFLLFLLAAFSTSNRPGRSAAFVSSLLYLLAYFTKQLALPIILAVAGFSILKSRGRALPRWFFTTLLGLVAFFAIDFTSQGWFSFYTVKSVALHHRAQDLGYFWRTILLSMWPAFLVGLCYLPLPARDNHRPGEQADRVRNFVLVIALLLASWSVFFKAWTYTNGFMPAVAGISMLAGLGTGQVLTLGEPCSKNQPIGRRVFKTGIIVLLLLQFGLLFYPPMDQLPGKQEREAAQRFLQKLRSLPGDVLVFSHGYVAAQAGKETFLHSSTIGDITGGRKPSPGTDVFARREQVIQVVQQAVIEQKFEWVFLDSNDPAWQPYYVPVEQLDETTTLSQVTGASSRPMLLLAKNPIARGGSFPLDDPAFEPYFLTGWGTHEQGARPALSPLALLRVFLEAGHSYQVMVRAAPNCSNGKPNPEELALLWNNEPVGEIRFTSCIATDRSFSLPAQFIQEAENELVFQSGLTSISTTQTESGSRDEAFSLVSLKFLQQ